MKKNRLSHSQVSRYQTCGKSYDYYYNHKLRSKYQSAALMFGSALDNAINDILNKKTKDPNGAFENYWTVAKIIDKKENLIESTKIVYSNSDYDKDILLEEDYNFIKNKFKLNNNEEVDQLFKVMQESKNKYGWDKITEEDKKIYNLYNWISMRRKGHLMLKAYIDNIAPNITKVYEVQKEIKLENRNGDKIIGYIDLIADWKDVGTVIFDLKTSSIDYNEDSVITSPQLSLYKNAVGKKYNTNLAGYIVLKKQVNKKRIKICEKCSFEGTGNRHKTCNNQIDNLRCNGKWNEKLNCFIDVQVLINKIPEQTEKIVMDNFKYINEGIKNNQFHRNFNSCERPWGPCEYKKLCFYNDDSDLINLNNERKYNGK